MKFLIFLILIASSTASRVLFLFPTPSKSHMMIVHAVSTALAEKNHEVTVVSPFPLSEKLKNHRDIKTPIPDKAQKVFDEMIAKGESSMLKMLFTIMGAMDEIALKMIKMQQFQEILDEKFDLIVIGMTGNNYLLGFGDHFKCPTAILSIQKHFQMTDDLVGNPIEYQAVPNFKLIVDEWNFIARVKNFLFTGVFYLASIYLDYRQRQVYK